MKFRTLRPDEIDVRIGSITKNGITLLLYKDARCDMNILDETIGGGCWQRDHKELKGTIYCGVGIYDEDGGDWVWKWDAGAESYTEKEKGEASDSFKRACVNWGIGRELYTSPLIFVPMETEPKPGGKGWQLVNYKDQYGYEVTDIQYDESRQISRLTIEKDRVVAFSYQREVKTCKITQNEARTLLQMARSVGYEDAALLKELGVSRLSELTKSVYTEWIRKLGDMQ